MARSQSSCRIKRPPCENLSPKPAGKCAEEDAAAGCGNPSLKPFRAEVGRIISLLTRNGAALAAQLRQVAPSQEKLDQAKQNLRRIQLLMFARRPLTAWHSYS